MKTFPRIKSVTVWVYVILIIGCVLCTRGIRIEKYRDSKVKGGVIMRPWNWISHASGSNYLMVDGKTYRGVRGLAPYYLEVPGMNAILFVTEESGRITFHIHDFSTKEDIQIVGGSGFGWGIGGERTLSGKYRDDIESVVSNRITLVRKTLDGQVATVLNLSTKSVEGSEIVRLNTRNRDRNRSTQTNGAPTVITP